MASWWKSIMWLIWTSRTKLTPSTATRALTLRAWQLKGLDGLTLRIHTVWRYWVAMLSGHWVRWRPRTCFSTLRRSSSQQRHLILYYFFFFFNCITECVLYFFFISYFSFIFTPIYSKYNIIIVFIFLCSISFLTRSNWPSRRDIVYISRWGRIKSVNIWDRGVYSVGKITRKKKPATPTETFILSLHQHASLIYI